MAVGNGSRWKKIGAMESATHCLLVKDTCLQCRCISGYLVRGQRLDYRRRLGRQASQDVRSFYLRSTYEHMRRNNMFWRAEARGLRLVNVELKLIVQRFMFFRDRHDGFLQAALQNVGNLHLSPWLAKTVQLTHSARATGFY